MADAADRPFVRAVERVAGRTPLHVLDEPRGAHQPAKPDQFGKVRKTIARVKTALNQKRVGGKA